MDELSCGVGSWGRACGLNGGIRRETVGNAPFFQIVRRHFQLHTIAGENADSVNAHSSCKRAEQGMTQCLFTGNPDSKGRVWKAFFYEAFQFDDVLRHRETKEKKQIGVKSRAILQSKTACSKARGGHFLGEERKDVAIFYFCC